MLTSLRRSWSSLRAGIQSVLTAMQAWKHESIFAEFISEEDVIGSPPSSMRPQPAVSTNERYMILSNTTQALQQLQQMLAGHEAESYWIGQLLQYLQRLQSSQPAISPDEQFSHLYLLRKWLFWVPVLLLQRQGGQGPAMLTLAHFYATALAVAHLYPDLGSAFCARIALVPLETIINVTEAMQSQRAMDQQSMEIAAFMQFPQQTVLSFRNRMMMETQQGRIKQEPAITGVSPETFNYTSIGNLSPAFAPSPLHSTAVQPARPAQAQTSHASYLEVPTTQSGFSYGTQSWGAMPSPGFPPQAYTTQDEQLYGYSLGGFRGDGFVTPAPIWT